MKNEYEDYLRASDGTFTHDPFRTWEVRERERKMKAGISNYEAHGSRRGDPGLDRCRRPPLPQPCVLR